MHTSTIRHGSIPGWVALYPTASDQREERGFAPGFSVAALRRQIAIWRLRARTRRDLALMDARSLDDIGLSRTEALRESRKPFWMA